MTAILEPATSTMNFGGTVLMPGAGLTRRPNGHYVVTVDIEFPPDEIRYLEMLHHIPAGWECYEQLATDGFDSYYYGPEGYDHECERAAARGGDSAPASGRHRRW